jgi:hypothetical protein
VGVVFWLLGSEYLFIVLTITSRIFVNYEKNKTAPQDEKLNVFPLVNLMLFEKFESLNFYSENAKLSVENFIEAVNEINETNR